MPQHKLFYVYEIKGNIDDLEHFDKKFKEIGGTEFQLLLNKPEKIKSIIPDYLFLDQEEIKGNVIIKDMERLVPLKIRSKSRLLFIETPIQREKIEIINFLNNISQNLQLETFVPTNREEVDFICNASELSSFKVFIDNEIVRSDETTEDLCKGLLKDMELIEVTLNMHINEKIVTFYYYGNAIQFPNPKQEDIEGVFQTFENTMMASAK